MAASPKYIVYLCTFMQSRPLMKVITHPRVVVLSLENMVTKNLAYMILNE